MSAVHPLPFTTRSGPILNRRRLLLGAAAALGVGTAHAQTPLLKAGDQKGLRPTGPRRL